MENDIPTIRILHTFHTRKSIKNYSWDLPHDGFALKPARGYGGEGILVFKHWAGDSGTTVSGKRYNLKQLQSHILDIFDGVYSLQSLPDKAYIEERLISRPLIKKYDLIGLPDIRVIVFNKIPVMAMLRLPTQSSGGRANLHQGAIAIGIDLRTGITKHAVLRGKSIKFIPGTKVKLRGIKINDWDDILLLASRAQQASGLGYAGVDIVIDKNKGPVVIEVNARPGLSIQNANNASLRERLERIEDLAVSSNARGVEIAKSIFAEGFSEKVQQENKILHIVEPVKIIGKNKESIYKAKLDTGAYRTSIDISIARELDLLPLKQQFTVKSASGRQVRPAVKIKLEIGGKKISTVASVADRQRLKFPIIIGRKDLKGFYVNPTLPKNTSEVITLDGEQQFIYEEGE